MINFFNDTALLVHACDRYELLYKGFSYFFSKYWDFNTHCRTYFATEEKTADVTGFENIRSGKGEWADRLRFLLEEKITEKYVIYFQEDMWLTAKTDAGFFNELFEQVKEHGWQQVKLHSAPIYKTHPTNFNIDGFNVALLDNQASNYLMSHQVTLWDKQFLINQLHKGEHPWRNERKATKRLKQLSPDIYHIDYFEENGNPPINQQRALVSRSGYYTVSMNGGFNDNIERYLPELKANAGFSEYAKQLEYNYANGLVHDGRQRPMKTDPFKKIKNWLLKN